jgi:hypothetical protein
LGTATSTRGDVFHDAEIVKRSRGLGSDPGSIQQLPALCCEGSRENEEPVEHDVGAVRHPIPATSPLFAIEVNRSGVVFRVIRCADILSDLYPIHFNEEPRAIVFNRDEVPLVWCEEVVSEDDPVPQLHVQRGERAASRGVHVDIKARRQYTYIVIVQYIGLVELEPERLRDRLVVARVWPETVEYHL